MKDLTQSPLHSQVKYRRKFAISQLGNKYFPILSLICQIGDRYTADLQYSFSGRFTVRSVISDVVSEHRRIDNGQPHRRGRSGDWATVLTSSHRLGVWIPALLFDLRFGTSWQPYG